MMAWDGSVPAKHTIKNHAHLGLSAAACLSPATGIERIITYRLSYRSYPDGPHLKVL